MKTAWVDLSTKEVTVYMTPKEDIKKFLGSRGYAAKILYDNVGPEIDPFSPQNILTFSTGLFTATPWPTGARLTVTSKSPLTGAYGYSNTGGFFGAELKRAGYDALILKGCAEKPVYLYIENEVIKILPAEEIWGKAVSETDHLLKERHPGCRVACIGEAGENLVRVAAIMNDAGRAAGRTGMGAVMGSKNVKAIAVKGTENIPYTAEFKKLCVEMARKVGTNPAAIDYRKWGTSILTDYKNPRGDLPAKNHQEVQVPFVTDVNAEAVNRYVYKNSGCFGCPIRCARHSRVESGPYKCEGEGPEYETVESFGPTVWNNDMEVIIYANYLCNELGLDTISTGVIIGFAMECHQRGYLNDKKLSLEWGDKETIIELIKMIARREGLGDILADGVLRASKKIHPETEKFALHVKGVEIPQQEPRTCRGLALGHVTSNRGADHLYGLSTIDQTKNDEVAQKFFPDATKEILDVFSQKYKPEVLFFTESFSAITDAIGICKFSTLENFALDPDDIALGLKTFDSELDFDRESLLKIGERIVNLERMYNYRHGFDRKMDQLPERFLKEPAVVRLQKDGKLTEEIIKDNLVVDLDEMLDKYYQIRGWNKNGVPTKEKLKELGLEELIKDL